MEIRFRLFILGGILLILLSACSPVGTAVSTPGFHSGLAADPVFADFYNQLGGEAILGEVLAAASTQDGKTLQYTEAGLMLYDPRLPKDQQFSLSPLGRKFNLPVVQNDFPAQDDTLVVNGIIIYSRFVDLYKRFGLTRFAGRPLSQPIDDAANGRLVQFFENVGFYTSITTAGDGVHLLAYGGADCAATCHYQPSSLNDPRVDISYEEPFLNGLSDLGLDLVGRPLTTYYPAQDGTIEQVYENVVVYAPANHVERIGFRPLPELVGIATTPPVAKVDNAGLVFIPLEGNLGHNVATVFEDYLGSHGGASLYGAPTTEIFTVGADYRQCFTAICLDYDPAAVASQRVYPAALGKDYLNRSAPTQAPTNSPVLSAANVVLQVSEKVAAISISDRQEIYLRILRRQDRSPIPNLSATLKLILPDTSQVSYAMPATDAQGETQVQVDPIYAANGTIIPVEVCLNLTATPAICATDSFVIWTNP